MTGAERDTKDRADATDGISTKTGAERDTKDRADATDGIGAKTGADFCPGDGGSTENHRREDRRGFLFYSTFSS